MKFIPLRDFDIVTSSLNFDTPDCHVTGGCDLYTTKAAGSDKKLYKDIDKSLESQHAALLKLGASLSPPDREELAASHNLSRSSPFGNLGEISSRRTFAYLIATLNASHPDYDFSHVLRPADFHRERNLRKVMSTIDSTLTNVRPPSLAMDTSFGSVSGASVTSSGSAASTSPLWGPQMWAMINKEMRLQDCGVFSYHPADNIFDEEDGAIWSMHYFFFSKALKRVAYLYVRAVPVMGHSPQLAPRLAQRRMSHQYAIGSSITIGGGRSRMAHRRGSRSSRASIGCGSYSFKDDELSTSAMGSSPHLSSSATKRSGMDIQGASSSNKRARYWLGDQFSDRLMSPVDDDDEDMDDVLLWSREDDSDEDNYFANDGGFMEDDDDISLAGISMDEEEEEEEECDKNEANRSSSILNIKNANSNPKNANGGNQSKGAENRKGPVRAMSEDIAARMDM